MKQSSAPNQRLESINQALEQDLKGRNDEEIMFELLSLLGLSKPDVDGTAVFKKQNLLPEATLRFYIEAAQRLHYFVQSQEQFVNYSTMYWKAFPKDRIMQIYAQVGI